MTLLTGFTNYAYSQSLTPVDSLKADSLRKDAKDKQFQKTSDSTAKQYDISDFFGKLLHPKKKPTPLKKKTRVSL